MILTISNTALVINRAIYEDPLKGYRCSKYEYDMILTITFDCFILV
jgi:hypothetical protein